MIAHPWWHPENVYAAHRQALELMVEILEAAVDDALPEARRRHPLPEEIPGALLGPLVRDGARELALSSVFGGQSLRAAPGPNMSLHLFTPDNLLRIRTRKLPDPEQRVPAGDQLEFDFPDDYANDSLFGATAELALFWVVKGDGLYRVILAAPVGFEDEASLSTWHGAVEVAAPRVRALVRPAPPDTSADEPAEHDDLDDLILPQRAEQDDLDDLILPQPGIDEEDEAPGNGAR